MALFKKNQTLYKVFNVDFPQSNRWEMWGPGFEKSSGKTEVMKIEPKRNLESLEQTCERLLYPQNGVTIAKTGQRNVTCASLMHLMALLGNK